MTSMGWVLGTHNLTVFIAAPRVFFSVSRVSKIFHHKNINYKPGCVVSSKSTFRASARIDGRCITSPRRVVNPTCILSRLYRCNSVRWVVGDKKAANLVESTHRSRSRPSTSPGTAGRSSKKRENVRSFPSRRVWYEATIWFNQAS